uniref:G_PROTEIN_RECEP_F1_2 domain-containing protein n=1 Tax=Macrostomum lignano TaxID=282301 RepID=A0A1I8ITZ4_9PLAT
RPGIKPNLAAEITFLSGIGSASWLLGSSCSWRQAVQAGQSNSQRMRAIAQPGYMDSAAAAAAAADNWQQGMLTPNATFGMAAAAASNASSYPAGLNSSLDANTHLRQRDDGDVSDVHRVPAEIWATADCHDQPAAGHHDSLHIVGNVFVVAPSSWRETCSVSNYLILSLAVADLMVATLVMPICALKEMSKVWCAPLRPVDLLDVLCCTASILHLVGIAVDRYWAVTNINYIRTRTGRRIGLMIAAIWIISAAISAPARFWRMRKEPDECRINESPAYTVFSTVGAFYLPMLFMIGIYLRIYHAARKRIRRKAFKPSQPAASAAATAAATAQQQQQQAAKKSTSDSDHTPEVSSGAGPCQTTSFSATTKKLNSKQKKQQQKQLQQNGRAEAQERITIQSKAAMQRERLEQKRERKAARTLAIITGCFLFWLVPFLLCPFYSPLCTDLISETGHSLIQWLGYTNSLLNPVIYTIFSPDFRSAFSKILFGRYRR